MKNWRHGSRVFWLCVAVAGFVDPRVNGADLEKLTDVRWIDSPANDGDSFLARAGDRDLHLRLYYVDCPESVVGNDVDAKRVREQAGYFGLTNVTHVVAIGRQASAYTKEKLAQPFTVYTAYADAMGRSQTKRIYAFIIMADGKDLAGELVKNGLARASGTRRATHDGISAEEMGKRFSDLEIQAMLKRAGAWREADPEEITRQRSAQREEERQLEDVRNQVASAETAAGPIDLNKAGSRQIQSLPGVGPALASRIITGRPYHSVDDLLRVKGVGTNLLEKIRARVKVDSAVSPPAPK